MSGFKWTDEFLDEAIRKIRLLMAENGRDRFQPTELYAVAQRISGSQFTRETLFNILMTTGRIARAEARDRKKWWYRIVEDPRPIRQPRNLGDAMAAMLAWWSDDAATDPEIVARIAASQELVDEWRRARAFCARVAGATGTGGTDGKEERAGAETGRRRQETSTAERLDGEEGQTAGRGAGTVNAGGAE